MLEIDCAGEKLFLLPEKAVFWPAARMLTVADVHLGKPAAFRAAGIAVPELTTGADLARLDAILHATQSERLVILGDLLHAKAGMQTEMIQEVTEWRRKWPDLAITLIPGNHDLKSGTPPQAWGIRSVDVQCAFGPFVFSHEPMEVPGAYVLAGHIHPALTLRDKFGPGIRVACFYFGERRAILPAFGSFTGMSEIAPRRTDRIFAIGVGEVVEVKFRQR